MAATQGVSVGTASASQTTMFQIMRRVICIRLIRVVSIIGRPRLLSHTLTLSYTFPLRIAKNKIRHKGSNPGLRGITPFTDRRIQRRYREKIHDVFECCVCAEEPPAVETVFGFIRGVLGCRRWSLRGTKKIEREADLYGRAYKVKSGGHGLGFLSRPLYAGESITVQIARNLTC
jgi:hypothetical protein